MSQLLAVKDADGVEIEGERAYPIYRLHARWAEDVRGEPSEPEPPWRTEFLPPGRVWNSTGYYTMFRERPSVDNLMKEARRWWLAYRTTMPLDPEQRAKSRPALHASEATIIFAFDRHETWCPEWFQHKTFDVGQSNLDALASFERYVRRAEREGRKRLDHLMGCEDRYRWTGSGETGSPEERTPPPCRCVHCKRAGVIRIGH